MPVPDGDLAFDDDELPAVKSGTRLEVADE
jgi:hypothetical protein